MSIALYVIGPPRIVALLLSTSYYKNKFYEKKENWTKKIISRGTLVLVFVNLVIVKYHISNYK